MMGVKEEDPAFVLPFSPTSRSYQSSHPCPPPPPNQQAHPPHSSVRRPYSKPRYLNSGSTPSQSSVFPFLSRFRTVLTVGPIHPLPIHGQQKQQLHDALGPNGLPYWNALVSFLSGKIGREELDESVDGWLVGAGDGKRLSQYHLSHSPFLLCEGIRWMASWKRGVQESASKDGAGGFLRAVFMLMEWSM